jgi:hypothetical protein
MPEFTYTSEENDILEINTSTRIATFKGRRYRGLCIQKTENGRIVVNDIPPDVFDTIDFNRISGVRAIVNDQVLRISIESWNDVLMLDESCVKPTSLFGSKRCC